MMKKQAPVDDVQHLYELVVLEVTEVAAEYVDLDLGLHVAPHAQQAVLELGADVVTIERRLLAVLWLQLYNKSKHTHTVTSLRTCV